VAHAGWILQLLALVVVGSALLVGLMYGSMRIELTMLFTGGVLFLLGRWLQRRENGRSRGSDLDE
jgi:hypothetical protein